MDLSSTPCSSCPLLSSSSIGAAAIRSAPPLVALLGSSTASSTASSISSSSALFGASVLDQYDDGGDSNKTDEPLVAAAAAQEGVVVADIPTSKKNNVRQRFRSMLTQQHPHQWWKDLPPRARSVAYMGAATSLHYGGYEFLRNSCLALFTSSETGGFGAHAAVAFSLANALISPFSVAAAVRVRTVAAPIGTPRGPAAQHTVLDCLYSGQHRLVVPDDRPAAGRATGYFGMRVSVSEFLQLHALGATVVLSGFRPHTRPRRTVVCRPGGDQQLRLHGHRRSGSPLVAPDGPAGIVRADRRDPHGELGLRRSGLRGGPSARL